jgi:hypothetical protein
MNLRFIDLFLIVLETWTPFFHVIRHYSNMWFSWQVWNALKVLDAADVENPETTSDV